MNRPALATAGTVLGVLLLLGGKAATSPTPFALQGSSSLSATAAGTSTGPVINTRYGPVQVEVVVAGGRITDVKALQLPTGGQSGQIADYSQPLLRREAIAAQSAGIHAVSGATYTSQGYASSLQSALDQLAASSKTQASSVAPTSAEAKA
ncbi:MULTISPECIES: FMN-binding protein [Nocardioides]|uniref:FMN-binding protein n=1 Tax=Nocardioides TaxID=1839 RepID=UPI00286C8B7B|nr:FMN-binding protein [Nocardioides sp.]